MVVLGEGVGLGLQPLLEDCRLRANVRHRRAGHYEDVLARLHRVIRRTGFGIAAIAACCLFLGRHVVVGGLDLGEGGRIGAQTVERLVAAREDFPVDVLCRRNAARPVGCAVGQRLGNAVKERLHIMRSTVAMHHRHHDGGAAEGAVASGEDLRVFGAHRGPVGLHAVAGHQALAVEFGGFGLLAHGHDHHAAVDVALGAGNRLRLAAAIGAGLAHAGLDAAQRDGAVLVDHFHGLGIVDDLDVLEDRLVKLFLAGRNFLRSAAVDDLHVLDAGHAQRRAAGVHGNVAAAHNDHLLGQCRAFACIDATQEAHAVDHVLAGLAGDAHGLAPPRADGHQHRRVALLEFIQRHVLAQRHAAMQVNARAVLEQALHVLGNDVGRQAEARNTPHHHAAGLVHHLVDVHFEARFGQVLRGSEAGGARTDDANRLLAGDLHRRQVVVVAELVHHVALEVADGQGAIAFGAAAGGFAGRVADAAADRGEGVRRGDGLEGLGELLFPDIADVGGGVGADGARHLAGGGHEVRVLHIIACRRLGRAHTVDVVHGDDVRAHRLDPVWMPSQEALRRPWSRSRYSG